MNNTPQQEDLLSGQADEIKRIHMEGYELSVRKARNTLFWVAGLVFAAEMISSLMGGEGFDWMVFGFALIISGLFVALGLWTKKKPHTAVLAGIISYIGYILLVAAVNGMIDGTTGFIKGLIGGFLVKIIIFTFLFRALPDAKNLQQEMESGAY